MHILEVRAGHEQEDIESGRRILTDVIAEPACTVIIVRGTGAEVDAFANRAAARADPVPARKAIWVKDARIFAAGQEQALFAGHDGASATIIGLDDAPAQWLARDTSAVDLELAWLQVEER